MHISCGQPEWLWLLPVTIIALVSSFYNYKKKKRYVVLIVRVIVITLLILALTKVEVSLNSSKTATIFLVDISDSVINRKEEAQELIKQMIKELPKEELVGVVTFGKDTRVDQFVTDKKSFNKITTLPIASATNLEKAIQGALSLYPENVAKRLVIFTDGIENEGQVVHLSSSLMANHIQVLYKQFPNNMDKEVYIDALQIPDRVQISDTFTIKLQIQSNVKTSAILKIYQGESLKQKQQVELETGNNTFLLSDTLTETGLKPYRATIEPIEDTNQQNNEYVGFTNAKGKEKVLVIEGDVDKGTELAKLLEAGNISFVRLLPQGAPQTMLELTQYKEIITVDVHAKDLPAGFLNLLEGYVKDYAGGVLAFGGENSFGLGAYQNTVLEEILPVYMEPQGQQEMSETSYVLVIDHSSSMGGGNGYTNKLILAKEAAIEALNTVRVTDKIGIVGFSDSYEWVVKLQKAQDKDSLQEKINGIQVTGGTSIYPAIETAYDALVESGSKYKHIILLTDGQDGYHSYGSILSKMAASDVTLSTVAVGNDSDITLLKNLASEGGGRYYYTDITSNIPRIFAKEILLATNTYLKNKEFTPVITSRSEMIKEVLNQGLPTMLGYVSTTKKETATNHLVSDIQEPILTSWQYGLGKTAVFCSDIENRWTANYANWEPYVTLIKNVVESLMTDQGQGTDQFVVTQTMDGAKLEYITKEYGGDTNVSVVYTNQEGERKEVSLEATAPGQYETEITLEKTGVYSLSVRKEEQGQIVNTNSYAIARQYSKEYRFQEMETTFPQFIKQVSAVEIRDIVDIQRIPVEKVKSGVELTRWFIIGAIILFLLDIIYRRIEVSLVQNLLKVIKPSRTILAEMKENIKGEHLVADEKEEMSTVGNKKKQRCPEKQKIKQHTESDMSKKMSLMLDTSQLLSKKEERNKK